MSAPLQPLLQLSALHKSFGGLRVTDDVNLTIEAGSIHALIGPNGAGKTTLINQITGELSPDAGKICLQGQDVTRWSIARRARAGMGRSYQINSLIPSFTVLQNLLLAVQAARGHNFYFFKPVTQDTQLVDKAQQMLALVGLVGTEARVAGALSYGQQRQVELAMAMASEPALLLLDEPMAGLGPTESEKMIELLMRLKSHYGMLLVEHDMGAVFALADVVSVLVYGQVIVCDTPQAVRASRLVREAYLGEETLP
jgi:branched-chain amino acid transport system ATP-binding protein